MADLYRQNRPEMAYTPSTAAVDALTSTRLPLLVVSTAQGRPLPPTLTPDHLLADQAMHGVQDLTNALWRCRRPHGGGGLRA